MRKAVAVSLIVLAMATAGCDRTIESKDPPQAFPQAGPVPVNVEALVNDGSVTLTWEISDSSSVAWYRVWVSDSTAEDFSLRDSTTGFSLNLDGLVMNRRYSFLVGAVTTDGIEGFPSEVVSARVSRLSIMIESGREFTMDREVVVQVNGQPATSHMILSESAGFQDAVWRPYVSQAVFTLSNGDGVKTVYARFQFEDGSQSGDPLSDNINLDTYARINSVTFSPSGTTFAAGDTITFELVAGEAGGEASVSFAGSGQIRLFDDGSGDGTYTWWYVVPNNFRLDHGTVTGSFTDAAGNQAPRLDSPVLLNIVSPPPPVTLSAQAESTFEIVLSWTVSQSDDFSAYRLFRDDTAAVTENSMLLKTLTSSSARSYTDTTLDDNTTYYYRVYVCDNSGLWASSNVDSAATFENSAPEEVEFIALVESDSTVAGLSWSISAEDDFESYRIYRDTEAGVDSSDVLVAIVSDRGSSSYQSHLPWAQPGVDSIYFRLYVRDRHGLMTGSELRSVPAPVRTE